MDAGLRTGDHKKCHLTNQFLIVELNIVLIAQQIPSAHPGVVHPRQFHLLSYGLIREPCCAIEGCKNSLSKADNASRTCLRTFSRSSFECASVVPNAKVRISNRRRSVSSWPPSGSIDAPRSRRLDSSESGIRIQRDHHLPSETNPSMVARRVSGKTFFS